MEENKPTQEPEDNTAAEQPQRTISLKDLLNQNTDPKPEAQNPEAETEEKIEEKPKEPDKKMSLDPQAVADNVLDLVDGIQQIALPLLYQAVLFNKTERGILKDIARSAREQAKKAKGGKFTIEYTEEQSRLLEDYADYEEYCNELPFSEKEIKLVKEPLIAVIKESQFSLTPKGSLVAAAFMLAVPRALPILIKKGAAMFGFK